MRYTDAVRFATRKHQGQFRKDGKTPYITHPLKVARILQHDGKVDDLSTLCAAVLHDTIEDTDTTYGELVDVFGRVVADLVREVTDDKSLPKEERKRLQIEQAPRYSPAAGQIKIADKIANLYDIILFPPPWSRARKRSYYEHACLVISHMKAPHPLLERLFNEVYLEGLKRLA